MTSIADNRNSDEDDVDVLAELETFAAHVTDINDGEKSALDGPDVNFSTTMENDDPNCFIHASFEAATYHSLFSFVMEPGH